MKDGYLLFSKIYDIFADPLLVSIKRLTLQKFKNEFHDPSSKRILEVGCGTGTQACMLANEGFEVIGLDRSPSMIDRARCKAKQLHGSEIIFIPGDAEFLPFPSNSFDGAVIQLALHEMDWIKYLGSLKEILRVLKKNGLFIMVDFVPVPRPNLSNLLLLGAEFTAGIKHFRNGRSFIRRGRRNGCFAKASPPSIDAALSVSGKCLPGRQPENVTFTGELFRTLEQTGCGRSYNRPPERVPD